MKINNPRTFTLLAVALLVIVGVCAYINCLPNAMFWDDDDFILKNRFIKDWRYFPEFFTQNLVAGSYLISNYWRPLLLTVFAAEWHWWQNWVYGWHAVSVGAHIGAGIALYFLLNRLFGRRALSLITAVLFTAHPVHNEAVVYVNSLGDPLTSIFIFSGLILYVRSRQSKINALLSPPYYLGLLMLPLGIMSKETGFVLAALVPFTDFLLLNSGPFSKRLSRTLARCWPFLTIAVVYVILRATALNFSNSFNFYNADNAFTTNMGLRLLTFFKAMSQYAGFLFFPHDPRVERQLPWAQSLFEPDVLFGGSLVAGMLWAGLRFWQKKPLVSYGVGWFFITIAPASNVLVPINAVLYEHFLYLPMIGVLLIVVDAVMEWGRRKNLGPTLLKVLMLVLVVFIGMNLRRNLDWRTSIIFYEKLIKTAPNSYRVINNLGMEYANKGIHDKAETIYLKAIALDPKNPVAYHNIAGTYRDTGRTALALENFKRAIALDPRFIFSYRALAQLYFQSGDLEEAKKYLQVVARWDPEDQNVQQALRMIEEALRAKALRIPP
ncbi:MAG: tetratricopeptide repeat protein [Candidatus Omnitrophica bacterium]|nr:tetratricopeptide repeat protein [Candidatus Omnitrophota bacterium]